MAPSTGLQVTTPLAETHNPDTLVLAKALPARKNRISAVMAVMMDSPCFVPKVQPETRAVKWAGDVAHFAVHFFLLVYLSVRVLNVPVLPC